MSERSGPILSKAEAWRKMVESNGAIFGVDFIKRTTGESRTMRARIGVKKYLAGGAPAYSFHEHKLVSVFDLDKMEYRAVPVEGVTRLSIDGTVYSVTD